jgi:hypothetical protein
MSSEDFFDRFSKGQLEDSIDFVEWGYFETIRILLA